VVSAARTKPAAPLVRAACAAWLAAVVAACGGEPSEFPELRPGPATAADEAALDEFDRRYLGAINAGDIETLASLTTEDHMMISGGRPPLTGKQALVDTMTRAFATFDIDETWTPEETMVSGDLAFRRGTWVVVATPKAGGNPSRSTGSFARIYRRQPDGAWYMVRDILATDPAPRN